jgi:hypothetical protein
VLEQYAFRLKLILNPAELFVISPEPKTKGLVSPNRSSQHRGEFPMPYDPRLRVRTADSDLVRASKQRGCQRLVTLKKALDTLPERKLDGSLMLATWNLREFGAQKMGPRLIESLFYIAEIINRFGANIAELKGLGSSINQPSGPASASTPKPCDPFDDN